MALVLGAAALAALVGVGLLVIAQWRELGADIPALGWGAYAAGGLATLSVSVGLFYVLFQSARRGHDDIDRSEDGPR